MPEFTPKSAQANLPPLPNDIYECVIGEPRPFSRPKQNSTDISEGVSYTCTVAEGEFTGRKIFVTLYLNSEGGQNFSKQFLIAANNFPNTKEGEQEFDNSPAADLDYSYDPSTQSCGAGFHELKGKRVKIQTKIQVNNNIERDQPSKYYPFNLQPTAA